MQNNTKATENAPESKRDEVCAGSMLSTAMQTRSERRFTGAGTFFLLTLAFAVVTVYAMYGINHSLSLNLIIEAMFFYMLVAIFPYMVAEGLVAFYTKARLRLVPIRRSQNQPTRQPPAA